MITIIVIDNVLAAGEDLRTAVPAKRAKALYDGFRSQYNTVGLTTADMDIARWWCKREHFDKWSSMLSYPPSAAMPWDHWRVDQVRGFLADGWEVFAYVDSNPQVAEAVRMLGVATVCVAYPHQPPGWKEIVAPRAWSSVVATMDDNTVP